MEQKTKKTNLILGLLLSLLTALGGGIVFGVVYGIGFYIYILSALEIYLACLVYFKHVSKITWWHIIISIIWSLIWTFIFNLLAIVACETIFISKEIGLTFTNSFKEFIHLWKTNSEVTAYMNTRISQIIAMLFLGGIIYGAYMIAAKISLKRKLKQQGLISNQEENIETKYYIPTFNACRNAILKYSQSKNQTEYKDDMKDVFETYISKLDEKTKKSLIDLTNNKLENDSTSIVDKKSNESILKLLNKKV